VLGNQGALGLTHLVGELPQRRGHRPLAMLDLRQRAAGAVQHATEFGLRKAGCSPIQRETLTEPPSQHLQRRTIAHRLRRIGRTVPHINGHD
jgi:hypothetical protein